MSDTHKVKQLTEDKVVQRLKGQHIKVVEVISFETRCLAVPDKLHKMGAIIDRVLLLDYETLAIPPDEDHKLRSLHRDKIHKLFQDLKAPIEEESVSPYAANRSEEHTSELQSHSFISYAVFCLKKKTTKQKIISQEKLGASNKITLKLQ